MRENSNNNKNVNQCEDTLLILLLMNALNASTVKLWAGSRNCVNWIRVGQNITISRTIIVYYCSNQ